MSDLEKYMEVNRHSWNAVTPYHIRSGFYDHEAFLRGSSSLKPVEESLLDDLTGKEVLHLQCHFGQDTISLQRIGAVVTGVDFSEVAIEEAKRTAAELQIPADFICCNIYDLPHRLDKQFDVIFTSYGVIGWLPDLNRWAAVISRFLKPGGKFLIVEFHPFVWTLDNDFRQIGYDYFNTTPIHESITGTYADREAPVEHTNVSWNHSLSEMMEALIGEGLVIRHFLEYDYSPYNCFPFMQEDEAGKFRFSHLSHRIPMIYAVSAVKPDPSGK